MTIVHSVADFYIDGKLIEIRVLHAPEPFAQRSIAQLIEKEFISIGEFCTSPNVPLSQLCDESHTGTGSVFLAISEQDNFSQPVGVSLYSQDDIIGSHEMAVLIRPEFRQTRLALELCRLTVEDAANNGVKALYTTDTSDDMEMRKLAVEMEMSVRLDKAYRRTRYSLQTDRQPWMVKL